MPDNQNIPLRLQRLLRRPVTLDGLPASLFWIDNPGHDGGYLRVQTLGATRKAWFPWGTAFAILDSDGRFLSAAGLAKPRQHAAIKTEPSRGKNTKVIPPLREFYSFAPQPQLGETFSQTLSKLAGDSVEGGRTKIEND